MKLWIIKKLLSFISFDFLVKVIAQAIAYIIEYARRNASMEGWEKAKKAVKEIKNWAALFDEVYEDDTLSPEEDKMIQEAIANCTATTTIYNLLQGREAPDKAKKPVKKRARKTTKKVEEAE